MKYLAIVPIALAIPFLCVFVTQTSATVKIQVFASTNSTKGEIVEEVKFGDDPTGPKMIDLKFSATNPLQKTVQQLKTRRKNRRHRFHIRTHCCQAGDLAGKHGLSCDMSRNFRYLFMNQTTRLRQKFQSGDKFHSKKMRRIYRRISRCVVNHEMKKAVQKCCLAYIAKEARWRQG